MVFDWSIDAHNIVSADASFGKITFKKDVHDLRQYKRVVIQTGRFEEAHLHMRFQGVSREKCLEHRPRCR